MDNKYCERCKSALIRCSECYTSGKQNGYTCTKCKGTGYICQLHDGNNGLPKKP